MNMDFDISNLLKSVGGTVGPQDTTVNPQTTQLPGDSIGISNLPNLGPDVILDVKPELSPPDQEILDSKPSTSPTTTSKNNTTTTPDVTGDIHQDLGEGGMEDMINNVLAAFPEFSSYTSLGKSIKQQDTQDPLENFKQALKNNAQKEGPPLTPSQAQVLAGSLLGKALIKMLQQSDSGPEQEQIQTLLNQVRITTLSLLYPSLTVLVDLQYSELIAQGKSPEEALKEANAQVLGQIDDNLSEQDVTKTVVGDNPKLAKAITQTLSQFLQKTMGPEGAILAGGIVATGNVASSISSALQNVTNVSQTSEVSPALNVQMTAMATGAVRTMNDQITELLSAENSLGATPANSTEWMRTLTLMMSKLQMLVTEMQIADTSNLKKISAAQVEVEKKKAEADLKKLDEQMKAQAPKPWWIKFLMVFFAVIIEIVMAAITIVTMGAAAPLLVAISVVMFGAMMALSETGILEKGLSALMNAFAHAISHLMPEAAAKAFLASMMILTAIIIAVVSNGAAASAVGDVAGTIATTTVVNVIAQTAQATAKTVVGSAVTRVAVKQAIDQVSIQLITMLIASSGVFQNIAIACTPDPIKQAAIAGALTVLMMIVTLGLAVKTGFKNADLMSSVLKNLDKEARTAAETILSKIVTTLGPVLEGVGMAGQAAVQIYGATISIKEAEIKKEIAELNKMIMLLEAIIKMLQDLMKGFQNDTSSLQNYSKSLSDSFERALQSSSQSMTSLFASQKRTA